MGRIIDTLAVVLVAAALLTAGVHAGHHDGLHVTGPDETVQTAAGNTTTASFVVNNTADRPVQQATLTITNASSALEVRNETVDVGALNASEQRQVPVEVYVPEGTSDGLYAISVAVQEGNRTTDNATASVLVASSESDDDGGDSGGSEGTTTEVENETGGPPPVVVAGEDDDTCFEFWVFEFCIPDWVPFF